MRRHPELQEWREHSTSFLFYLRIQEQNYKNEENILLHSYSIYVYTNIRFHSDSIYVYKNNYKNEMEYNGHV